MLAFVRRQQGAGDLPVGKRSSASLADQVESESIPTQPKAFDHISGQARTQVARARADDDRIDRLWCERRALQRRPARIGGQSRSMLGEATLQRICVNCEHFIEGFDGQAASLDAVVAGKDDFGDGARTRVETLEPVGGREGIPAIALGIAAFGQCGADSIQVHRSYRPSDTVRLTDTV